MHFLSGHCIDRATARPNLDQCKVSAICLTSVRNTLFVVAARAGPIESIITLVVRVGIDRPLRTSPSFPVARHPLPYAPSRAGKNQ